MAKGYPDYRYFSFPVSVNEGGTGVSSLTLFGVVLGNATSPLLVSAAGAADQVFRVPGPGGQPAFGAVDLTKAAAVTGLLPIASGGTGTGTPSLVAGANIGISGSWPNQTVAVNAAPSFTSLSLTNPLPVAYGGTGTATGSITGTGALTFAAGGSNQDITLTPTGTGRVVALVNNTLLISNPGGTTQLQLTGSLTSGRLFQDANGIGFASDTNGAALRFYTNDGALNECMRINSSRNVGIGTNSPGAGIRVDVVGGHIRTDSQLISTVAIGTAPLAVTSTTKVANLNAERVADTQITNSATTGALLIGSGSGTAAWGTPDGARVYRTTAQSLSNNTETPISFDGERYDNGGLHEGVTNPSRLTAQKAGVYVISGHLSFASNTTGTRAVWIKLNGNTYIAKQRLNANAPDYPEFSITTIYHLVATDYVELTAMQDSGGNLNVQQIGNISPEFAMQWVGP